MRAGKLGAARAAGRGCTLAPALPHTPAAAAAAPASAFCALTHALPLPSRTQPCREPSPACLTPPSAGTMMRTGARTVLAAAAALAAGAAGAAARVSAGSTARRLILKTCSTCGWLPSVHGFWSRAVESLCAAPRCLLLAAAGSCRPCQCLCAHLHRHTLPQVLWRQPFHGRSRVSRRLWRRRRAGLCAAAAGGGAAAARAAAAGRRRCRSSQPDGAAGAAVPAAAAAALHFHDEPQPAGVQPAPQPRVWAAVCHRHLRSAVLCAGCGGATQAVPARQQGAVRLAGERAGGWLCRLCAPRQAGDAGAAHSCWQPHLACLVPSPRLLLPTHLLATRAGCGWSTR